MLLKIKKILGCEKLHPDIQFFLDCSNLRIARSISIIIMSMEIITFVISFFYQINSDVRNPEQWMLKHRLNYLILFLSALQLCIYSFTHKPEKGKFSRVGLNISIAIFLLVAVSFATYISIQDYILNEQILVFITLELFVACLFMIKPYIAVPALLLSFSIFYYFMDATAGISGATKVNYPVLLLVFFIVNITHYSQYLRIAKNTVINHNLAEQLRLASLYDPLTKLKNRNALKADFENAMSSQVIFMLTDIDDFKSYNDTCGHNYGDELLSKFAGILQSVFGTEYCYRYGGDEYIVMVPELKEKEFLKKLDKCIQTIGDAFHFSGGYTLGTVSSSRDLSTFISKADENLYKSKRSGKNKVTGN